MSEKRLIVSSSPHLHGQESIPKIMHTVLLSLVPAFIASVYYFGLKALLVTLLSLFFTVLFEMMFLKMRGYSGKRLVATAFDGSAMVTGVLLAFNLPATSPWWMILIGSFVAMGLGKHAFGGLGNNIFNPALVARVFLLISFPAYMSTWMKVPEPLSPHWLKPYESLDEITGKTKGAEVFTMATPLGLVKAAKDKSKGVKEASRKFTLLKLFVGKRGGSLGEVSIFALLLGALLLFYKRYITWHIPVSFLGALFIFTLIPWLISPDKYLNPLLHILSGGAVLGAFFMATDMVTSPVSKLGMIIFGAGCGVLTGLIRLFGAYPEGVSFAILIMNGFVPIIDKYVLPKKFGEIKNEQ